MKKHRLFLVILVLACLGSIIAIQISPAIEGTPSPLATSTVFTDDEFQYQITVPKSLVAEQAFHSYYHLGDAWRLEGGSTATGTARLVIPVLRRDQDPRENNRSYPLYFVTEVRIGVSRDASSLQSCRTPGLIYHYDEGEDIVFGGSTWKHYRFTDEGVDQYVNGDQFHTLHHGACYALEVVRTGSNYRDDTMTSTYSDAELDAAYSRALAIAMTFTFNTQ